jgi:hypothetical protein
MKEKKKLPRLSFKKEPQETGLRSVGHPSPDVAVKHDGKLVGLIRARSWQQDHYSVGFMVEGNDDNLNCSWRWVFLKNKFETEDEVREYLKKNHEKLCKVYQFHPQDADE